MILEMANFDKVANGVKTSDKYIADNGQRIVNLYNADQEYNVGDVVCTIPLDAVKYCRTEEDLSQYGFVRIQDNLWGNTNE